MCSMFAFNYGMFTVSAYVLHSVFVCIVDVCLYFFLVYTLYICVHISLQLVAGNTLIVIATLTKFLINFLI